MRGYVSNIQRFSVHDGPGIRSTAFLQGCTLRCAWCHNPETIPAKPALRYQERLCIRCGACERVCPTGVHQVTADSHRIDRSLCIACGKCVEACPTDALSLSAREMTARETADELCEDRAYYDKSGGGITLSGGEPLFQGSFAVEILRLCKERGIHTCLDTALQVPAEAVMASLAYTDLYLADYKMGEGLHEWTGGNERLILSNLRLLCDMGAAVVLRCPIVPGVNDNEKHLRDVAKVLGDYGGILRVELMPYHRMGVGKYREIGREYALARTRPMEKSDKDALLARAQQLMGSVVRWG